MYLNSVSCLVLHAINHMVLFPMTACYFDPYDVQEPGWQMRISYMQWWCVGLVGRLYCWCWRCFYSCCCCTSSNVGIVYLFLLLLLLLYCYNYTSCCCLRPLYTCCRSASATATPAAATVAAAVAAAIVGVAFVFVTAALEATSAAVWRQDRYGW